MLTIDQTQDWFRHLYQSGLIDKEQYTQVVYLLLSRRQATNVQAFEFAYRAIRENPDVFLGFRAKKRILEGVKL